MTVYDFENSIFIFPFWFEKKHYRFTKGIHLLLEVSFCFSCFTSHTWNDLIYRTRSASLARAVNIGVGGFTVNTFTTCILFEFFALLLLTVDYISLWNSPKSIPVAAVIGLIKGIFENGKMHQVAADLSCCCSPDAFRKLMTISHLFT